jgi:hypothetical protein
MSNPGLDVVNTEVDDMLSARRQAEIAELSETLAICASTATSCN